MLVDFDGGSKVTPARAGMGDTSNRGKVLN